MKKVEVSAGASTPINAVETEKLLPKGAMVQPKVETKGLFNGAAINLFLLLAIGSCKQIQQETFSYMYGFVG